LELRWEEKEGNKTVRLKGASFPEYALAAVTAAQVPSRDSLGQDRTDCIHWQMGPNKTELLSPLL